jgi:hypothetical protein
MAWENLNLRTGELGFDSAAKAGPQSQNPKGRRLIPV